MEHSQIRLRRFFRSHFATVNNMLAFDPFQCIKHNSSTRTTHTIYEKFFGHFFFSLVAMISCRRLTPFSRNFHAASVRSFSEFLLVLANTSRTIKNIIESNKLETLIKCIGKFVADPFLVARSAILLLRLLLLLPFVSFPSYSFHRQHTVILEMSLRAANAIVNNFASIAYCQTRLADSIIHSHSSHTSTGNPPVKQMGN